MRACVVLTFGTVIVCEPSFGVESRRVVGKVCPPLVESEILTLAALTGALVVFATSQVMVCVEFPAHVTAVSGAVY